MKTMLIRAIAVLISTWVLFGVDAAVAQRASCPAEIIPGRCPAGCPCAGTPSSTRDRSEQDQNRGPENLLEILNMLRQMEAALESGEEKSCLRNLIAFLDCLRKNFSTNNLEMACPIPSCSDRYAQQFGIDLEAIIRDAAIDYPPSPQPSPSSSGPVGWSRTLDYEAGTPRYKTAKSGGLTGVSTNPRRISRPRRSQGSTPSRKVTSASTKPARCVSIESHPKELQWVYVDAEKYGLREGCNGTWKSYRYRFNNWGPRSRFALLNVPVYATVVNARGDPSSQGCCADIQNGSPFPVYYSVEAVHIGNKLLPGQRRTYRHSIYQSKTDKRGIELEIYVMWWEPDYSKETP